MEKPGPAVPDTDVVDVTVPEAVKLVLVVEVMVEVVVV
jgi:hypothetical protein